MSVELLGTAAIGSTIAGLVSLVAPLVGTAFKRWASKPDTKDFKDFKLGHASKVRITFVDESGKSRTVEINADSTGYKINETEVKELIKVLEEDEDASKKVLSY